MPELRITKNYTRALECEGHPTLFFEDSTNVRVVVYLEVTTKDERKNPSTLLVSDERFINSAIESVKESYGENFASIEILKTHHLTHNQRQNNNTQI